MASEPVTAADHEADAPTGPTSAEDRKAAAALSNLDSRGADDESGKKHEVDTEALGKAMESLSVGKKGAEEAKKKVKVEAKDVTLLVDQLDVKKDKATELLKSHEGDPVKAMLAWVTAEV